MNLYFPTAGRPHPLAWSNPFLALLGRVVRLDDGRGYLDFIGHLWRRGLGFVLVEHDVLPTVPQVLELDACLEPWCAFAYAEGGSPSFGCVKFSAAYIEQWPTVWENLEAVIAGRLVFPGFSYDGHQPAWQLLDAWHNVWSSHHHVRPHVHPGTVTHRRLR